MSMWMDCRQLTSIRYHLTIHYTLMQVWREYSPSFHSQLANNYGFHTHGLLIVVVRSAEDSMMSSNASRHYPASHVTIDQQWEGGGKRGRVYKTWLTILGCLWILSMANVRKMTGWDGDGLQIYWMRTHANLSIGNYHSTIFDRVI